jgi:glucosamine 6-phosphate synthetase-like amidotransferase/phosphosugar isomerase protein
MGEEIKYQIDDLPAYSRYLRSLDAPPDLERTGNNCVFVGAGDSFAAAKAVEYLSGFRARALDPYDLLLEPTTVEGKHLFVISVSGRTRTNIEAAKAAHGIAERVTGITSDVRSALAEACDDVIELRFRKTGAVTPGTVSYTTTLLACYSRLRELPVIPDLRQVFDSSVKWSDTIELPTGRTTFIVGTGLGYCMPIYGAAKIFEVLGSKSQYQATEQFSHMELFSLSDGDFVILIASSEMDWKAAQLEDLLAGSGWNVAKTSLNEDDEAVHSLLTSMQLQVLVWRAALRLGLEECSFKRKEKNLRISDQMIY